MWDFGLFGVFEFWGFVGFFFVFLFFSFEQVANTLGLRDYFHWQEKLLLELSYFGFSPVDFHEQVKWPSQARGNNFLLLCFLTSLFSQYQHLFTVVLAPINSSGPPSFLLSPFAFCALSHTSTHHCMGRTQVIQLPHILYSSRELILNLFADVLLNSCLGQ